MHFVSEIAMFYAGRATADLLLSVEVSRQAEGWLVEGFTSGCKCC